MSWVAVAAGAAAVLGAGASYAGSKKQSDAAKKGANLQMDQFRLLNAQQQPYIQSGYGAMGKLNTLLGIGAPRAGGGSALPTPIGPPQQIPGNHMYRPTPGGGMRQQLGIGSSPKTPPRNARLAQLLAIRAANGDEEAARILGGA